METKVEQANKLNELFSNRDMNEANTRHQIIDKVIHELLSWPQESVLCEEYINPGFADYILTNGNKKALIIEAKKEGEFFTIPNSFNSKALYEYIKIENLLTDDSIKAAIQQVQIYCVTEGIPFACITNGHEWIFFKPFEFNKQWKKLNAFVIKSLKYFSMCYTHAVNNLSYSNIFENASLKTLLNISIKHKELFYPKTKITSYNHPVDSNTFACYLTPIVDKYFGDISATDKDFMENCYVKERSDNAVNNDLHQLLQDSLTPYFLRYKINQLRDDNHGGQLGNILLETSKSRIEKLITIYGGKGAGKSTFLKRLLLFNPPQHLKHFAKIAIVDLLEIPENKEQIQEYIWSQIVIQLDTAEMLESNRDVLIKLFNKEYELANKQDLYGIEPTTLKYQELLNSLITKWKTDSQLCAKALCRYHNKNLKGIIISIDNTDQYSPKMQDYCFTIAKNVSKELRCITIISMREERFFASNIHGTLDAYKITGFHISSPKAQNVFQKRIEYLQKLLKMADLRPILLNGVDEQIIVEIISFLNILLMEFKKANSSLNKFLSSCTQGNIRLALQLFREFVLSGYTNIFEMVSKNYNTIRIHQVLKPVMIPSRYYYDENLSYIPNIFQIRSKDTGSHFTCLRILQILNSKYEQGKDIYTETAELAAYFADNFLMLDDFKLNVDMMLKHGLIEARNRLDSYAEEVDALKITAFGVYFLCELNLHFTYLDLVCVDCGLFNEELANSIILSSNDEIKLFLGYDKKSRLLKRISKVRKFISYLAKVESTERNDYGLTIEQSCFSEKIAEAFKIEIAGVLKSAKIDQLSIETV